ncbi:MAG: L,D-transpeptidase family protein [Methylococcales bacterium]|nr:L,D-transpeptidase family protein [Methylococcales bacterium]
MKPTRKITVGLALTTLLVACSTYQPIETPTVITPVKPQVQTKPNYIPPINPLGERTVEDIQQIYGANATRKLNAYFTKAKVSFPPKEITLVALKQERKLELWARDNKELRLIHTYNIQAASGVAGPKLRLGDKQVPEGIYRVEGLNPNSHYHLSMKLNYPNEFDLLHAEMEGRTEPGSDIFIHGRAVSIGCLAMGDETIEELFILTTQIGAENVKVVIAPHDPRVTPLTTNTAQLPLWTTELYANISREINALSTTMKSAQSMGLPSTLH